jgi:hypothetical protein
MSATAKDRIGRFVNRTVTRNGKLISVSRSATVGETSAPNSPNGAKVPEEHLTAVPPARGRERDDAGRFQPGCKPGPGNPFARRVATLRKALLESVSEGDVAELGRKLLAQALAGDVAASKVLLSYVVGKPTEVVDPDRIEIEAWKLLLAWPTLSEAVAAMIAVPPGPAIESVQTTAPATSAELMARIANEQILEGGGRVMRRREEKGR